VLHRGAAQEALGRAIDGVVTKAGAIDLPARLVYDIAIELAAGDILAVEVLGDYEEAAFFNGITYGFNEQSRTPSFVVRAPAVGINAELKTDRRSVFGYQLNVLCAWLLTDEFDEPFSCLCGHGRYLSCDTKNRCHP
jgi:hypothetical protein